MMRHTDKKGANNASKFRSIRLYVFQRMKLVTFVPKLDNIKRKTFIQPEGIDLLLCCNQLGNLLPFETSLKQN